MNFVRSNLGTGVSGDGRRVYPFTAILAQETMKLALLLNAVNPAIGGIVVRGQKGTAKSTAARGLRDLLPALPDGGRPAFVDFPLGATEDMVIGSIDFEAAVRDGMVRFQPGLLARAHHGVLYIDEVNLLDDHLVDSILGAAESGENVVEREGQSLRHASRFILIGTMNPEEGELRPQLLDRFGLAVSIEGETDPALRVELLKRREAFDAEPDAFLNAYRASEADLAQRLEAARKRLPEVMIPAHLTAFSSRDLRPQSRRRAPRRHRHGARRPRPCRLGWAHRRHLGRHRHRRADGAAASHARRGAGDSAASSAAPAPA
jgi:magnesium chelatase subunit D